MFISQHEEKGFLALPDRTLTVSMDIYHFIPSTGLKSPEYVPVAVRVLSNRAHSSLTEKRGLCKHQTKGCDCDPFDEKHAKGINKASVPLLRVMVNTDDTFASFNRLFMSFLWPYGQI